jgi:hypothetical protein
MLALPPVRRATLRSFWLALSVVGGLLLSLLAALVTSGSFAWGIGLAFVFALPGVLWPEMISLPYRVWNRLARDFARYASLLVMGICFYLVLGAVSRTGSSLSLTRSSLGASLWVPHTTLVPATYINQHGIVSENTRSQDWIATLASWGRSSGNLWACCLLPFLILLSVFATEQETNVPTDIYTLF